jgi:hypothetical protein
MICAAADVPTICAPNARLLRSTLAMGTGSGEPVPDRAITGLIAALVSRSRLADFPPVLLGVKVTLTEHDCPAETPELQVFVSANIAASVPAMLMPLTVRVALPVFETVTICAAADVPTDCELNARMLWSTLTTGAGGGLPEPPLPLPSLPPGLPTTFTLPVLQPPHNARMAARVANAVAFLVMSMLACVEVLRAFGLCGTIKFIFWRLQAARNSVRAGIQACPASLANLYPLCPPLQTV